MRDDETKSIVKRHLEVRRFIVANTALYLECGEVERKRGKEI